MKDLATVLQEELHSAGTTKRETVELILDGRCRATDLTCLEGMEALTKLSLCNVGLASLEGFPSLPNLTRLILADNRIAGGLHHLEQANLSSLTVLSLAHNRIADTNELEPLKELQLTNLDLCECPLAQNTPNYRDTILAMFPSLDVLDNLDREGIELLDDDDDPDDIEASDDDDDELEEESDEDDDAVSADQEFADSEFLNLVTDSDDDDQQSDENEDSEPEEIHVSVLAGPPIADEKSDEDQDYVMSEHESASEEGTFESDEDISVSQHFGAGGSSSAAAGSSEPAATTGTKRKRTTHGTEDLERDIPRDEDYEDI